MTKEEIYRNCIQDLSVSNSLLLELPTGFGKTRISLDLVNYLVNSKYQKAKTLNILIFVAKRVHKQTWKEEIEKWGGIKHPTAEINICMECYESLKNHCGEKWDIILGDECHHLGSELRLELFSTLSFGYFIGLSATISKNLKQVFKYRYNAEIVYCNIIDAIAENILPELQILLLPLMLDSSNYSETYMLHPKGIDPVIVCTYAEIQKYRWKKNKVLVRCTQRQKSGELNMLILKAKNAYLKTRSKSMEQLWLYHCGKRLEFYSDCKMQVVKQILEQIKDHRSITFCKTIQQAEQIGKWCIHSKNSDANKIYNDFNSGKIDHITAVNILNENANLVNCKYAIFCNLSSSDVVQEQRIGRSLRHPSPVIVIPYYKNTREEEIVQKYIEGFDSKYVRTISSVSDIV